MKLKKIVEDLYQQMTGHTDDHEIEMAITDLRAMAQMASELAQHFENEKPKDLEGWVQAKITKAADYINAVHKNHMFSPDQDCHSCGDVKEAMEPKSAYGDQIFSSLDNLKSAASKIMSKPENYSVLTDGKKFMLTTNRRAGIFVKQGGWEIIGSILPDRTYRPGTESWNSASNKWAIQEEKSTCCGKCGHKHVKGTSCPKPYLTGKRHCRNRK